MVTATTPRTDVYTRVTNQIVASLEQGVRPWLKPWNAEHAAGRITRPLRHNGLPYQGINILMLWASADLAGYACPFWLTFKQALELGGHVRKGEVMTRKDWELFGRTSLGDVVRDFRRQRRVTEFYGGHIAVR